MQMSGTMHYPGCKAHAASSVSLDCYSDKLGVAQLVDAYTVYIGVL
jgi:hypothetical protein